MNARMSEIRFIYCIRCKKIISYLETIHLQILSSYLWKKVGKLNMVIIRKKARPFFLQKNPSEIKLFYLYEVDNFYNTLDQGNIG